MSVRLMFAAALALSAAMPARAADPIPVVASFTILADMVREIGGDRVKVTTLVGPGGDAHVFQPSPADATRLAEAKAVFVNGLHFEGWMDRLIDSAGYTGPVVVATAGVAALPFGEGGHEDEHEEGHEAAAGDDHDHGHGEEAHAEEAHADGHAGDEHAGHDHGDVDPHAWQNVANAVIYARNVEAGLKAADPEGAADYAARAERYVAELQALDAEIRAALAAIPAERRKVITSHDAFGYFAAAYGLEFVAPQGASTESEASAAAVARIIDQIREEKIPAVFVESITDQRLLAQISDETGARIGGELYSDSLSDADGPAGTYLAMMRHNVETLRTALGNGT